MVVVGVGVVVVVGVEVVVVVGVEVEVVVVVEVGGVVVVEVEVVVVVGVEVEVGTTHPQRGRRDRMIGKGLATIASGCICGYLLFISKGEHGIGWFILSLFLIWL